MHTTENQANQLCNSLSNTHADKKSRVCVDTFKGKLKYQFNNTHILLSGILSANVTDLDFRQPSRLPCEHCSYKNSQPHLPSRGFNF